MTAIYVEEFSADNKFARFVDINIRNLAGVPSVVYGVLGPDRVRRHALRPRRRQRQDGDLRWPHPRGPDPAARDHHLGRGDPRRADALREGGFGLGASRWQVVRQLILPAAAPGILTGTVLSLSRAIGETAPLILVGAVLGSFSTGGSLNDLLTGPYTALPTIIFDWARKPQQEFQSLTSAAIVVLLVVTIVTNAFAILLRNRYDRSW
jgi:phosphate transport system permease protein